MALCNVTGTVYLPNGDVASRREVVFYKLPDNVTADYLGAVVPEPIIVRTDSAGDLDVNLITGNYYGHVQSRNGKEKYPFRAIVPEATTADFADLIAAVDPVEPLPAWLQQALQARDEAVQAADSAEDSADLATALTAESPQSWAQFSAFLPYANGKIVSFNGVEFIRDSSANISGLPTGAGWRPFGVVYPAHFGGNELLSDSYSANSGAPSGGFETQRSMVNILNAASPAAAIYVAPRSSGTFAIGVFHGGVEGYCHEYEFGPDAVDWWRIQQGRMGTANPSVAGRFWTPDIDNPSQFVIATTSSNSYTTTVGAKFRFTFQGPSVALYHNANNQGGVWRFTIDGVTKDVSTWSATSGVTETMIFDNLNHGQVYTGVAEFIGDDPLNPPVGGASRGWMWYRDVSVSPYTNVRRAITAGSARSFGVLNPVAPTKAFSSAASVNEFAITFSETAGGPSVWVPSHGTDIITDSVIRQIRINGVDVTPASITNNRQIQSFQMTQQFMMKIPGSANNLASVTTRHSMASDGVMHFDLSIRAVDDFYVNSTYLSQWAAAFPAFDKLVVNNGGVIPLSGHVSGGYPYDKVNSFAFTGPGFAAGRTSGVALDFDSTEANWRLKSGRLIPGGGILVNNRVDVQGDNKIYIRANQSGSVLVSAGQEITSSLRIYASPNDAAVVNN